MKQGTHTTGYDDGAKLHRFKAFSIFPFLPTAMHIILNVYFKYVFNNWCVQHQDSTHLTVKGCTLLTLQSQK